MDLAFGEGGLIPVVVQDRITGDVRMLAWADREAVARTLSTGRATFWSRSRKALWVKGETSGHVIHVRSVIADCDADALVYLADPVGPSCHTGAASCFFRRVGEDGTAADEGVPAATFLGELEREIEARKASTGQKSYTRHLLDGGPARIGDKLREEADELSRAIAGEGDDRVASEAADLLYHLMVGIASRGVPFRAVIEALAARSGQSGHDEKASRKKGA
jgi:phosphoribosyl-ATP pyrophosphohydrolase/phosphoribosyl-AMP cyclohydrolase